LSPNLRAQSDIVIKEANSDCINAIDISALSSISATAPKGNGALMEISSQKGDLFYFEKEHNTVWYSFIAEDDALLSFDIIPNNPTDDYDFILFACSNNNCCNSIIDKTLKPVRTNISRARSEIQGITGLSENGESDFVHEGKGNNFSNSVEIKKGFKYYLVLDNVYGGDGGHRIVFKYKQKQKEQKVKDESRKLSFRVVDLETNKSISANISIISFDKKYNKVTLLQITDSAGLIKLDDGVYFEVLSNKEAYLNDKQSFRISEGDSIINVLVSLRNIKVGSTFELEKVFFVGGSPSFAAGSQKALRKLYYVLKSNEKLQIQIQGHVNLPNGSIHKYSEEYYNKLSVDRAKAVYDYLIKRGIDKSRLKYKGFGYSQMVYPDAITRFQMEKNRRVEMKVIGN